MANTNDRTSNSTNGKPIPVTAPANQGIDYGMGQANVDKTNGIRFGVISQHSLMPEFVYEEFESEYGPATCPKCGNEVKSTEDVDAALAVHMEHVEECEQDENCECDMFPSYREYGGCADYTCLVCRHTLDSDQAFGDEPIAHVLKDSEYFAHYGNDGFGVFVEKSPYYTYAPFCSPCAPGAGDLDSPCLIADPKCEWKPEEYAKDAVKTYCFGHDCFDEQVAPYRVWRVEDDTEVIPETRGATNA